MKIRLNFISNSSSSSFIICGNDVKNIIKNGISISDIDYFDSYKYEDYFIQIELGKINEEIFNVLNESEKDLFELIFSEMENTYYCYINHWNEILEVCDPIFQFGEKTISLIEKCKNLKDKNNSSYDKLLIDINTSLKEDVNNIILKLKKNYKEIVIVSAGDNHGDIYGEDGWYIESKYLGKKLINSVLKADFKIIGINQH